MSTKHPGAKALDIFINLSAVPKNILMIRDPKEKRLNWGVEWADYLTSQRDFIVGRLLDLDADLVAFEEQEELGKATVAKALAVLRFSLTSCIQR